MIKIEIGKCMWCPKSGKIRPVLRIGLAGIRFTLCDSCWKKAKKREVTA